MIDEFIQKNFKNLKYRGNKKWMASCPAHDDKNPSLSIEFNNDRLLLYCHAGCSYDDIIAAASITKDDLKSLSHAGITLKTPQHRNTKKKKVKKAAKAGMSSKTPQHRNTPSDIDNKYGCTLEDYSDSKKIPVKFSKQLSLRDISFPIKGTTVDAIEIPYFDETSNIVATRKRIALTGKDKFRWSKGDKPTLYGRWKIEEAEYDNYIVIVEGESDCHTLWFYNFHAIGVPGVTHFKNDRDSMFFENIDTVYYIKEPDAGGDKLLETLLISNLKPKLKIVDLGIFKDPSEMHCENPKAFKKRFQAALNSSLSFEEYSYKDLIQERKKCFKICEPIARNQDILNSLIKLCPKLNIVGEERLVQLIYLAITTRFFDRPVSLIIQGTSSSGKSYTTETIINNLFPLEAYYFLSSMSEKAMIYTREDFKHRFIVIREYEGIHGEFMAYILRSLLSEGKISYEVTERDPETNQFGTRRIDKEGPTGLILTTTREQLNPENENRALKIQTDDSAKQTKRVMQILAVAADILCDFGPWVQFQTWLSLNPKRVFVPYATGIADLMGHGSVTSRRDISKVFSLIMAHALVHQLNRDKDDKGRIIASLEDYIAIYKLVDDVIAQSIKASIPVHVTMAVTAIEKILEGTDKTDKTTVSVTEVAHELGVNKSTASRYYVERPMAQNPVFRFKFRGTELRAGSRRLSAGAMPLFIQGLDRIDSLQAVRLVLKAVSNCPVLPSFRGISFFFLLTSNF